MDLKSYVNLLLFGYFPYVCLAVFFVGSLIRFDREQYSWTSESSQLLRTGPLRWGSNLFHIGMLGIFGGHLTGFLTPIPVWQALGVPLADKQMTAMVGGGIFGAMCVAGLALLLVRRLGDARIRATSQPMDIVVLFLLLAQAILGLITIALSAQHPDGSEMVKFMVWAQRIVTFRGGAAELIAEVPIIFKLHIVIGLTIFLVFPFTRLVHIWSGFAAVFYLFRPYQLMRTRRSEN